MVLRLSSFPTDVLGVALTGLSTASSAAVVATDTELVAFGKLQAQSTAMAPALNNVGRNLIHNSMFRVQQRGAGSWTTSLAFTADRWLMSFLNGSASVSIPSFSDAGRAAVGDESAKYQLTYVCTGSGGAGDFQQLVQKIEDVRRLANQTVTVSFWAVATSGTPKLGANIYQSFGTGGSPSAGVQGTGQSVTLSTTWARYSLTFSVPSASGKTLGTTAGTDFTQLSFWFSTGSTYATASGTVGNQSATFTLWGVQLEVGSVATALDKPDLAPEKANCQRFYQDHLGVICAGYNATAGAIYTDFPLPVTMRAAPVATLVGPTYSNASAAALNSAQPGHVRWMTTITATGSGYVTFEAQLSADL